MAISAATLQSPTLIWSATLTIGGTAYTCVERLPNRSTGFDQQRSTCSVLVKEFPDCESGDEAIVTVTLNGESTTFFTGRVDARPIANLPLSFEVTLVDVLAKLATPLTEKIQWRNTPWATAVQNLLHMADVSDSEIASIYDPGSTFTLGAVETITIEAQTKVQAVTGRGGAAAQISDILDQLMEFASADLRVSEDGRIEIVAAPRYPTSDESQGTYAVGASLSEFGIISARRTLAGSEGRIKRFTASGPRLTRTRVIPDATFTLAGEGGKTERVEYPYCQTDDCAEEIARDKIVRLNWAFVAVDVTAPLNPNLRPGHTIMYRDADLGWPQTTPALVLGITTTDDTMSMRIAVGPEPPQGTLSKIPPPSADFTIVADLQPVELAGQVTTNILACCTSQASDPNGLAITSLKWTATCAGSVYPETAEWSPPADGDPPDDTGKTPVFIFSTFEGALVTLEVESESGEGAVNTKPIDPGSALIFTRQIGAATLEGWRVLTKEASWRGFGATTCTAVPNINDMGPFLAGFADGTLYVTEDALATPPTLLYTFPSQVNTIYIDEVDGSTITVSAGNSVYQSADNGMSWQKLADLSAPVLYAEHAAGSPGFVRACSGHTLQLSLNRGGSWVASITGPEGSTCRKFARAIWGCAAVFDGVDDIATAFQLEDGAASTIDWSLVTPPIGGFTAICPLLNEPGWLLATGGINDVARDGLMDQLAYVASGGGGTIYKIVQTASGWQAVAQAEVLGGGTFKLANYTSAHQIDDVATGTLRVGYGGTSDPTAPPMIVYLPRSGHTIYRYAELGGWQSSELPDDTTWYGLAINPAQPEQWVVWDRDRFFWTGTSGVAWVQIFVHQSTGGLMDGWNLGFAFTGRGANWVLTRHLNSWYGTSRANLSYIATGSDSRLLTYKAYGGLHSQTYPPSEWIDDTQADWRSYQALMTGYGGEVVVTGSYDPPGGDQNDEPPFPNQIFLYAGGLPPSDGILNYYWIPYDLLTGADRQMLAVQGSNIGYAHSYTTMPTPVIAAGGSVVSVEAGIFCGNREGVAQILNFDTVPTLQIITMTGWQIGGIVRGRRRKAVAAPVQNSGVPDSLSRLVFFNGVQWGLVDTPLYDENILMCSLGIVEV